MNFNSITPFAIIFSLILVVISFIILRLIALWFYKIDRRVELAEQTNKLLNDILASNYNLEKISESNNTRLYRIEKQLEKNELNNLKS